MAVQSRTAINDIDTNNNIPFRKETKMSISWLQYNEVRPLYERAVPVYFLK